MFQDPRPPLLVGRVAPPNDMMEAAIRSLSPDAFLTLMSQTGHKAPTPEQLVAAVEAERNGTRI